MLRFEITILFVFNLIKYVRVLQLDDVHYETMAQVFTKSWRKTPKLYNDYKKMFSLKNKRKNNDFDYNYEDWEEKEPNYYNFFINNTFTTLKDTTPTANTTIDTTTDSPTTTLPSSPPEVTDATLEASPEATTETINDTTQETEASTTSSVLEVDTTTKIITFTTTTSTITTSLGTITTSTEPPAFDDIFNQTTVTEITMVTPEIVYLLNEITEVKTRIRGGYFTSGLIVLLRKMSQKKSEDLTPLLVGLHAEVTRLNSNNQLQMFGPLPLETFTTMVQLASVSPPEMIQLQAKEGITILENRRSAVLPDMNAILDIADTIFNDDDLHRLAIFLKDIESYPNTSLPAIDIASDGIKAFVMMPYERIEGTAKERLLMMEINNAVKMRLFPEHRSGRRKIGSFKVSSSKRPQTIKKHYLRTDETTQDLYTNYVKNKKIMNRMKYRMKIYKEKFKSIKQKERGKSKRGPTSTTTTTTTTTPKPTMHRSKYYMRKYVKKNLYRMKTTTKKTTKFRYKYYGKIRKFNIDTGINSDLTYTKEKKDKRSDSEGYYSDINYKDENSRIESDLSAERDLDELKSPTVSYSNAETPIKYASNKIIYKDEISNVKTNNNLYKVNNKKFNKLIDNKLKNKINNLVNTDVTTDIDVEAFLKANIKNAVYHKDNFERINDKRRYFDAVTNKLRKESVSDEEIELKRNIYKAIRMT